MFYRLFENCTILSISYLFKQRGRGLFRFSEKKRVCNFLGLIFPDVASTILAKYHNDTVHTKLHFLAFQVRANQREAKEELNVNPGLY